ARPDGETIATLERLAQQLAVRLTPPQRPVTVVRVPPPRQAEGERRKTEVARPPSASRLPSGEGMEWTGGAAHDALLHELRAPLGAASYALDAMARVYDGASRADAAQIAPMLRTARCGVME